MKIKTKRFLLIFAAIMMFGSTAAIATTVECDANQTDYSASKYTSAKKAKDNYALLTVTQGPDRDNCPMMVYVEYVDHNVDYDNLKTETKTLYSTCTNQKLYYNDPFDSSFAINKGYKIYFKIIKYSRFNSATVSGTFTP